VGQKNLSERPLAVTKAYAYARAAQGCGYSVEVKVETSPAMLYSSGEVMLPASVTVWLTARDEYLGVWGDTLTGGWTSRCPGQGSNATTKFIGGFRSRTLAEMKRFRNERGFATYLLMDSYRVSDPDKYGIVPEDSRITAPEWSAEDWGL
jgi:hypothetical protein